MKDRVIVRATGPIVDFTVSATADRSVVTCVRYRGSGGPMGSVTFDADGVLGWPIEDPAALFVRGSELRERRV